MAVAITGLGSVFRYWLEAAFGMGRWSDPPTDWVVRPILDRPPSVRFMRLCIMLWGWTWTRSPFRIWAVGPNFSSTRGFNPWRNLWD